MKILAVCSTINFRDFTRRTTIEALKNLDLLLYTSLKNIFKEKIGSRHISYSTYHFWIPDNLKKYNICSLFEHKFRAWFWKKKISKYDWVFFTDPNQAWLLPYLKGAKIVYLLRDPNVLQSKKHQIGERELLNCADLVLATSISLTYNYAQKYYGIVHKNIHYWPNCVDLNIWNIDKIGTTIKQGPIVGIAGNFSLKRTDYLLLEWITSKCPDIEFEIAGNLDYNQSKPFWDKLFALGNVRYLGNIPYEKLPEIVARWAVGLVTDKIDEYSSYMHHNKVYQYLALGIPVVSLKIHKDYEGLYPYVLLGEDYDQFSDNIYDAIEKCKNESFTKGCISMAKLNSSDLRATDFISKITIV